MQIGAALVLHWCGDCAGVRAFEAPPCSDGHPECPEFACLECGAAIVVAGLPGDVGHARAEALTGATDASWALPRSA